MVHFKKRAYMSLALSKPSQRPGYSFLFWTALLDLPPPHQALVTDPESIKILSVSKIDNLFSSGVFNRRQEIMLL